MFMKNHPICSLHNEPALFFNQDSTFQTNKFVCRFCISQKNIKFALIEDYQNKKNSLIEKFEQKSDENVNLLRKILDDLQNWKNNINTNTNKLISIIINIIEQDKERQIRIGDLMRNANNGVAYIRNEELIMGQYFNQLKNQLQVEFQQLVKSISLTNIIQVLNSVNFAIQIQKPDDQKFKQPVKETQKMNKQIKISNSNKVEKFEFQVIKQNFIQLQEWCRAICFNEDSTQPIAGCDTCIKVFKFENQKFSEIQKLTNKQFVSRGRDNKIIIWRQQNKRLWEVQQILEGHSFSILSLILNKREDLLISGSLDQSIRFWKKTDNFWNSTQIINCTGWVFSLSLNTEQDKLIASLSEKQILVFNLSDNQWIQQQQIDVQTYGQRVCFLNENQFVFQPFVGNSLDIYDYNTQINIFENINKIVEKQTESDDCLFPTIFIDSKGILLNKNCKHINIIKQSIDGKFEIVQSIPYDTEAFYGGASEDGKILAIWGSLSYQIQIRKFTSIQ